jgi:hypothetical protein
MLVGKRDAGLLRPDVAQNRPDDRHGRPASKASTHAFRAYDAVLGLFKGPHHFVSMTHQLSAFGSA